jgi:integrase
MSARRGSGSVFQQPGTDCWTIQYYVRGKRVREATGLTDYKGAQQKLTQRLGQIDKGEYIERPGKPVTVAELFEGLRRSYRVNGRRSLRSVELRWKHLQVLADYLAINVTTSRLNNYVDQRLKEGASNASINRELSALKTCFHIGFGEAQFPRIPKFPHLTEHNVRSGFVSADQFGRLIQHAHHLWLRLFLECAFSYGWRRSELLSLKVEQVDLLTKTIRLDPIQTKNARPREVAMTAVVYELAKQAVVGKAPEDCLLTRGKKPIKDFRDAWTKLCTKASVKGLLVHDLRRSAARQMRQAGVAETTIMDMAGWETRAMFKRYAIVDGADIRAAVGKLEQARAENSHKNSHNLPSEAQTEAEAAKGLIN